MGKAKPDVDEIGKELDEQIRANESLLQGLKYAYGQAMQQALDGQGEPPPVSDLQRIRALEAQLHNDKMFREARAMTRGL